MRRPLALFLAAAAGCRAPEPAPKPAPPRQFAAADGTAWHVNDGRAALADGERPYPAALPVALARASTADAGSARPVAVELTVSSYRQLVRDPAYGGPGDYRPLLAGEKLFDGMTAKSPGEAGFLFGLLGVLEVFNVARFATLSAVATNTPDPVGDPGATSHLRGSAALVWSNGRRTVVPVDAVGQCPRGAEEKGWGAAVQSAQDQMAAAVWRQVWQAVRAESGDGPPPAAESPLPAGRTDLKAAALLTGVGADAFLPPRPSTPPAPPTPTPPARLPLP